VRILLPLLLLSLAACSKAPEAHIEAVQANAAQAETMVKVEHTASLSAALDLADHASLTCLDPTQCPAGVGMLLAADDAGGFAPTSNSIAACTAVLVGEDLALTNSHCIPSAVKLLPDLCASRVRIAFAGNEALPAETVPCAALVGFSKRATPMSPDLALIRLVRKMGRAPFPAARTGVEPESVLRSYRVNPDLKNRAGSLVSDSCRAVAGSYRMPVYTSASSSVLVLGDCNVIPGNSGSALVSAEGALVGVVQATLPLSAASQELWGAHSSVAFAPLSMGTSLRCLKADPALGTFGWDETCATIEDEDVASARPLISELAKQEPLTQEIAGLLAPFLGQSATVKLERAVLTNGSLDRRETLRPACGFNEPVSLQIPVFNLSIRFNRYLQLAPAAATIETVAEQTFEPADSCATD
jgi:hypothetical protein